MEFDLQNQFPTFQPHPPSDSDLFSCESQHIISQTFKRRDSDVSFRRKAICLILQAQTLCHSDPVTLYLAVNYMDRFISRRRASLEKSWVLKLIVTSCLSLASKMKKTPFSLSDFQREEGYVFDVGTVRKMELFILDTLSWQMRWITPFSFLHFFMNSLQLKENSTSKQALKNRTSEIILNAHYEMEILEHKPSVIAASAILLASHELFPQQLTNLKASISSSQYVDNENLRKCFNLIEERVVMGGHKSISADEISSTRTPLSVLQHQRTRQESENVTETAITMEEKTGTKRRRLNVF